VHTGAIGPFPAGVDPDEYDRRRRRVLWRLPTGLYLCGSRYGGQRNLMTCNLVTQVATAPKLVAVAVEQQALTLELIEAGGAFSLSLLDREDKVVVRTFAKPAIEDAEAKTLSNLPYEDAPVTGSPIPAGAVAWIDCRLERTVELGSHVLCIGEVVDAGLAPGGDDTPVLRSEDTRMNYGG